MPAEEHPVEADQHDDEHDDRRRPAGAGSARRTNIATSSMTMPAKRGRPTRRARTGTSWWSAGRWGPATPAGRGRPDLEAGRRERGRDHHAGGEVAPPGGGPRTNSTTDEHRRSGWSSPIVPKRDLDQPQRVVSHAGRRPVLAPLATVVEVDAATASPGRRPRRARRTAPRQSGGPAQSWATRGRSSTRLPSGRRRDGRRTVCRPGHAHRISDERRRGTPIALPHDRPPRAPRRPRPRACRPGQARAVRRRRGPGARGGRRPARRRSPTSRPSGPSRSSSAS